MSWSVAVLAVVLAFGLGYGVRRLAEDDEQAGQRGERSAPAGLTFRQAASVPFDMTRRRLLRRFAGRQRTTVRARGRTCFLYPLADRAETAWRFCFEGGRLSSSSTAPL